MGTRGQESGGRRGWGGARGWGSAAGVGRWGGWGLCVVCVVCVCVTFSNALFHTTCRQLLFSNVLMSYDLSSVFASRSSVSV